jgi:hypothetical protein
MMLFEILSLLRIFLTLGILFLADGGFGDG